MWFTDCQHARSWSTETPHNTHTVHTYTVHIQYIHTLYTYSTYIHCIHTVHTYIHCTHTVHTYTVHIQYIRTYTVHIQYIHTLYTYSTYIHCTHTVHCILVCTVRTLNIIQSCPIWHISVATRTIAIHILLPSVIQYQNTHYLYTITCPSQPCLFIHSTLWLSRVCSNRNSFRSCHTCDDVSFPSLPHSPLCVCRVHHAGKPFLYTTRVM